MPPPWLSHNSPHLVAKPPRRDKPTDNLRGASCLCLGPLILGQNLVDPGLERIRLWRCYRLEAAVLQRIRRLQRLANHVPRPLQRVRAVSGMLTPSRAMRQITP